MPEFNNIKYELNNGEKFALICGMLAGLKLQDKTQPPSQLTVTLEPIRVNGLGCIGLMSPDVKYEDNRVITIPVTTHDVDREYSGFSLNVSYDCNRVNITKVTAGDFGELQVTRLEEGKAYVGAMLDEGKFIKEPCIVCWLHCYIIDEPTINNPIELKFNNSTGSDINYCSLLTWVQNDIDKKYYSYFITPTVNKGCKIVSDIEKTENNLGDTQEIAAESSPSSIALGTARIEPGKTALIPIYTNCNKEHNLAYNKFKLIAHIPVEYINIVSESVIQGVDEWTLEAERYYDKDGNYIMEITGTREEYKVDNSTAGFIRFGLALGVTSLSCYIRNTYSELIGESESLGVYKGDGYLYYSEKSLMPEGGTEVIEGSASLGSGGASGGLSGSGKIYSGGSQTIWISLDNGNKYPIYLEPGWNDVVIFIPNIIPEDMWIETNITIESDGYILIPGGFEWQVDIKQDAPLGLSSPRITDRFEFKDIYDILKETPEPPINLDEILDTFNMVDMSKQELLNIIINDKVLSSNFELQDFINIDIEHAPAVFDKVFSDNLEIVDVSLTTTLNVDIKDEPEKEIEEITDVINIFIPEMLQITGTVNNEDFGNIEGLGKYEENTRALLKAVANSGYKADKWYIAGVQVGEGNTLSLLVNANIEVYLEFIETLLNEFDLAINKEGSSLEFTNESSIPWIINTSDFGGVKSGQIGNSGLTEISTTIPYSGTFSYDYKVSSESNYDYLKVYKNDTLLSSYSGTATENDKLIGVTAGDIIKFTYSKDRSGSIGDDACYIRNVYVISSSQFNKAINKEGSDLEFENISNIPWFVNTNEFGGVQSGVIGNSENTSIITTINKAGTFYFDYKVSSESGYDKLIVYKNNLQMYVYSGENSGEQINFTVVAGDTVQFTYSKDSGGAVGNDTCYIKNVYLQ